MRKFFFYATIASAAIAAYLLYKRGVPLNKIAEDVIQNPIGTLVHELQQTNPA